MDSAKVQEMAKMKEQAAMQRRFRQRQNRVAIDFGENAAFYKVIIDNNLFRPLGWVATEQRTCLQFGWYCC